jgi:hypothetical protein
MSTRVAGAVLMVAALFQGGVILNRATAGPGPAARPPLVFQSLGDTLGSLQVLAEGGSRKAWRAGSAEAAWTVVMAFRSDCVPSRNAAPAWREWLGRPHPVKAVAVTRDSLSVARRYRDSEGWAVPVLSVNGARRGTPEHLLVARTPWLFLVDPQGIVRYQGDGTSLAALDAFIARHVTTGPIS